MTFFEIVLAIYMFSFSTVLVLAFFDYLFGIDKLNPVLDNVLEGYHQKYGIETLVPMGLVSVLSLVSCIVYFFSSNNVFFILYYILGYIVLSIIAISICIVVLRAGVVSIRKYFISKKSVDTDSK